MVILNLDITINKNNLFNSINNIMEKVIEYYFDNEMLIEKKDGKKKLLEDIVKKELKNNKNSNYFWYLNSSDNNCTHIYRRGNKNGHMCQKKIRTNLNGEKPDYLCCQHSKKHVPKNKLKNEKIKFNDKNDNKDITLKDKFLNICNNIDKYGHIYKNKKSKYNRKCKKRKNIYIGNFGIINLDNILKHLLIA